MSVLVRVADAVPAPTSAWANRLILSSPGHLGTFLREASGRTLPLSQALVPSSAVATRSLALARFRLSEQVWEQRGQKFARRCAQQQITLIEPLRMITHVSLTWCPILRPRRRLSWRLDTHSTHLLHNYAAGRARNGYLRHPRRAGTHHAASDHSIAFASGSLAPCDCGIP